MVRDGSEFQVQEDTGMRELRRALNAMGNSAGDKATTNTT
jgi:hypothetical protein